MNTEDDHVEMMKNGCLHMHLPTMHCGLESPRSRSADSGFDGFVLSGIFALGMRLVRLQRVKMSRTNTESLPSRRGALWAVCVSAAVFLCRDSVIVHGLSLMMSGVSDVVILLFLIF